MRNEQVLTSSVPDPGVWYNYIHMERNFLIKSVVTVAVSISTGFLIGLLFTLFTISKDLNLDEASYMEGVTSFFIIPIIITILASVIAFYFGKRIQRKILAVIWAPFFYFVLPLGSSVGANLIGVHSSETLLNSVGALLWLPILTIITTTSLCMGSALKRD